MSSMEISTTLRKALLGAALLPILVASVACHASDADHGASAWDSARARLIAQSQGPLAQAISRWQLLTSSDRFGFTDYAGFILGYRGFPDEGKLRRFAEAALERQTADASSVAAYFDKVPPLTNPARAHYALALKTLGRPEAEAQARAAWRGGPMSDAAETALLAQWGSQFTPEDQDARIDALLWSGTPSSAARQLPRTSPARKGVDAARLATLIGIDPYGAAQSTGRGATSEMLTADPGFVYARARQLRRQGNGAAAQALLANRPLLARPPLARDKWVDELLANARGAASAGDPRTAYRIAAGIDDAFAQGEDVSQTPYDLRDDYTSLMWLGGQQALRQLGNGANAAPLFWRYGAAARTPGTRSKGFYWAGLAAAQAGQASEAQRYFELAAAYADQFYGLLALERLSRPLPRFPLDVPVLPTAEERGKFNASLLTQAVREVARDADWRTTVRFFREISEQQQSKGQHVLVAELARNLGRRDLGVMAGQAAAARGYLDFQQIAFPLIPVPQGYDHAWTMIHAIARQESQFAQNAVSHAGARGLMQLMPATANEQAGKLGLAYSSSALIEDAGFNIRLGGSYFQRLLSYYNGSYPLAVAAYNAGAGNVNKWLRANGDPRQAGNWIEWIERIPLQETRNYVQRVLENAVVYEAMNPERATYRGSNPLSHFLGKQTPG
jgi:soluble lytic murein transglycosylase